MRVLFCIRVVVIETVLYINCCTDDSTIPLNFVEIKQCVFPLFVSVFMILNMEVKVKYRFVCLCAVLCKDFYINTKNFSV